MVQGNQIGAKLAGGGLEFANINPRGTSLRPHLLQIRMKLIHTLLQPIDITTQEHRLGAGLTNTSLQLEDTSLDLVDIRAQGHNVEVDSVRDGTVGLEFAADVLVLTVPAVDIAILSKDGRSKFEHTRVQLIHAVMEMEEGQFGARRCGFASDRRSWTGHGEGGAGGTGVTPFQRGQGGHNGSIIIVVV